MRAPFSIHLHADRVCNGLPITLVVAFVLIAVIVNGGRSRPAPADGLLSVTQ